MVNKRQASFITFSLFNPAFCSLLLIDAIKAYSHKKNQGMPISLSYLLFPVVFNPNNRKSIGSNTKMIGWIESNQDVLISFADLCNGFIDITNNAIDYSIMSGYLSLNGDLLCVSCKFDETKLGDYLKTDSEIKECYDCARVVGRWFSETDQAMIYRLWRIKP